MELEDVQKHETLSGRLGERGFRELTSDWIQPQKPPVALVRRRALPRSRCAVAAFAMI
jgi:hypothetical protein